MLAFLLKAVAFLLFWIGVVKLLQLLCRKAFAKHTAGWSASDKVVVITGASSGIGAELALRYSAQGERLPRVKCPQQRRANTGAKVAICARRAEELDAVAKRCQERGAADVLSFVCDVADPNACHRFIEATAKKFDGVIDLLVLNAGISMGATFAQLASYTREHGLTDQDDSSKGLGVYDRLMQVNYVSNVHLTGAALPYLLKSSRSKIVAVSSLFGVLPGATRTGYCATKWALQGFFDSLRMELRPHGTEVTIICPGAVATEINRTRLGGEGIQQLDMKAAHVMSVETAGQMIVDAVANGVRELHMTNEIALGRWLKTLFPELLDFIAVRRLAQIQRASSSSSSGGR